MKTVTNTFRVSINAKPEAVFAYVSDLTRHGEWNSGLRVEAVTPGPVGVGSQYRSWGKPGNRQNDIEITDYQPPTRFTFVAHDPNFKSDWKVRSGLLGLSSESASLVMVHSGS